MRLCSAVAGTMGAGIVGVGLLSGCATLLPAPNEEEQLAQTEDSFDPFKEAVETATEASALGRTADTEAEWQEIAQMWQTAGDLMRAVPATHPKYEVAQQRANEDYATNLEIAQQEAGTTAGPAQTTDDDRLTKVDFGEGWPFVIDGELQCEQVQVGEHQLKLVTLHGIGQVYAINGPAQARAKERGWRNIDDVWRSSSVGSGKAPLNWVLMRAEASCSES